jgi:hypothetical protein
MDNLDDLDGSVRSPRAGSRWARTCLACGVDYFAGHSKSRFCSHACAQWACRRHKAFLPWGNHLRPIPQTTHDNRAQRTKTPNYKQQQTEPASNNEKATESIQSAPQEVGTESASTTRPASEKGTNYNSSFSVAAAGTEKEELCLWGS